MHKKTKYYCIEGTEGVGKTTHVDLLVTYLKARGFSVLQTKEPGTPHSPLTMELRKIMLDQKYDSEITVAARELVSQAIRSIHYERVIAPALGKYDFIVQDRGILSGLAYGTACGNDVKFLRYLAANIIPDRNPYTLYDDVILLKGNVGAGLERAISTKQEFEQGDAMESRGENFMNDTSEWMNSFSRWFNTTLVTVDGKDVDQVFNEIIDTLGLR